METNFYNPDFLIPKEEFWSDKYFPYFEIDYSKPHGNWRTPLPISPEPFYLDLHIWEGGPVPIWTINRYITNNLIQVSIRSGFDEDGDYREEKIIVDKNTVTKVFMVRLKKDATNNTFRALGHPSKGRIGIITKEWHSDYDIPYEDSRWEVEDIISGKKSVYRLKELDVVDIESTKEKIRELLSLKLVSKQGFLPKHIPENVSQIVYSQLTGFPEASSINNQLKKLKQKLFIPMDNYNKALRNVPLPHGPQESNFAGGKRKTRRQQGRKKTRKSK